MHERIQLEAARIVTGLPGQVGIVTGVAWTGWNGHRVAHIYIDYIYIYMYNEIGWQKLSIRRHNRKVSSKHSRGTPFFTNLIPR